MIDDIRFVDVRDINTRRREGILFNVQRCEHYKARQDPLMRAMEAWNSLLVCIRNAESQDKLKTMVMGISEIILSDVFPIVRLVSCHSINVLNNCISSHLISLCT